MDLALVQSLKVVRIHQMCNHQNPCWHFTGHISLNRMTVSSVVFLPRNCLKKLNVAMLSLILVLPCCEVASLPVLGGPLEEG